MKVEEVFLWRQGYRLDSLNTAGKELYFALGPFDEYIGLSFWYMGETKALRHELNPKKIFKFEVLNEKNIVMQN